MTEQKEYYVELIHGHKITRRGLAFLICKNDRNIDAKSFFERLKPNQERRARSSFDHWLDGGTNKNWFHGWPNNPTYKDCFVFKWKENRQDHRLYGFLCNPLPNYSHFRLCVLVSHAQKNAWETNPTELDGVNKIKEEAKVKEAVRTAVKDLTPQ
jgi:hypothetical protein